jgi:predicted acyl esterase
MTDPPPELAAAVIAVSAHEAWIRGASARPRTRNGFRRQPDAVPGVAHVTGCGGPVWRPMRLDQAFERVNIPVLLQEGWQDRFVDQMIEQYERLRRRGIDVGLTIGPWTHVEVCHQGRRNPHGGDPSVVGRAPRRHGPPASAKPNPHFVTGAQEWRFLPRWPPVTNEQVLYLQPDGELRDTQPTPTAAVHRCSSTIPRIPSSCRRPSDQSSTGWLPRQPRA